MGEIATINIRDFLDDENDGEIILRRILSTFSCPKNRDLEIFLKKKCIDFSKMKQASTYIVLDIGSEIEILGYFSITLKSITIKKPDKNNPISRNAMKKISRLGKIDEESGACTTPAFLIAQLGKNYSNGLNNKIEGTYLLTLAIDKITQVQRMIGGTVIFLEAEAGNEKLDTFYSKVNGFKKFDTRNNESGEKTYVQYLKVI